MDEDIKGLLKKNLEASEKALGILRKMHRAMVWGRVFIWAKWVLVAALLIVGYVQIQPYLNDISLAYQDLLPVLENLQKLNKSLPTLPTLR